MRKRTSHNSSIKSTFNWWLLVAPLILFAAAAVIALATFLAVRNFVASWEMTDLPGVVVRPRQTPTPGEPGETGEVGALPANPIPAATPEPWDGASRVNLLVVGLDYRDWETGEGAPRTDTMILLSIDPLTMTAGMLSIPRDLWVTIPGFEPNRINTAYRFGEIYKMPGGGPGLAMIAVEGLLGLQIDYYAQIDFYAFERFIDEIYGVKIDVPEPIKIDPIGEKPPRILPAGVQTLPGDLALAYARARNSEGADFDRAKRQQQVIMGIRNRILSSEMLPILIAKAPTLYEELSAGVHTNMTLDQVIRLAWLARQISEENIKRGIIGSEHVTFNQSPDGDAVLKPRPQQIRLLRDEIFTVSGAVSPAAASAEPKELMQAENARLSILNGAGKPGLATRTKDYLNNEGATVVETGDAAETTLYTIIVDHTGNPYTVKYLVELMGISPNKYYLRFDPESQVDVVITLGYDWANGNSMP